MPLGQRGDVAVVGPGDQAAFPMPRHGAILDLGRPFADRYRILDLAQLQALLRGMSYSPFLGQFLGWFKL